jgi:O-methyltransferase involved in polyketide biosynthesis
MSEADQLASAETSKPTAAGIYDAYLGGTHNTKVEREAAEKLRQGVPEVEAMAWANRSFHQRAVRWLAEQGIRQFIDLGSGLPTQENTHQVAQRVAPESRVLYVDHDPRTSQLGKELVADSPNIGFIMADLTKPDAVLNHPERQRLIDLDQPVAVLATAVLHFIRDEDDPWGVVKAYVDETAPGSYIVLNHITADRQPRDKVQTLYAIYRSANEMIHMRNREQVEWFFRGLQLMPAYEGADPKVTYLGIWGAEDPVAADDETSRWAYCGVARKA